MNLILYKSTEKQFADNGLGILSDAYNAGVHEVQNGEFTLTFYYPIDGVRFSDIKTDNIVTAKPNSTDAVHAFRIFSSVPDIFNKYVTVTAESITNDLLGKVVKSFSYTGTGIDTFKQLAANSGLDSTMMVQSDLTDSHTISVETTNVLAAVVAAATKTWTGEIKRENNMVSMLSRRGRNYPMKFSLNKNIQGIKITTSTSDVIAGIYPYVRYSNDSGQQDTVIFGDLVKSAHYSEYANPRTTTVAIQGRRSSDTSADKNLPIIDNKTQLNAAAATWFSLKDNMGIDQPTVTVAIDIVSVQQTTDYTIFPNNLDVGLFDKVQVDLSEYGISLDMTVSEITYDPIYERVSSIVLGDLAKKVTSDISATIEKISQVKEVAYDAVANAGSANALSSLASGAAQQAVQDARNAADAADIASQGAAQAQQAAADASNTAVQAQSAANKATDIANQTSAALDRTNAMASAASSMASQATTAAGDAKVAASSASSMASQANESLQQTLNDVKTAQETANLAKQQAENNATVAQSAVDVANTVKQQFGDLSVGGRNLYTDTKNFDNLALWVGSSYWKKTTDTYKGLAVVQTTQDWSGLSQYIPVKKGDVLTYSVYAKYTSGTATSKIFWSLNHPTEGSYSTATTDPYNNVVTITDSWQRISATAVATSDGYLRPRLERNNNKTNTLQISGIKLETGNLPTDWTPAPEDIQADITSAQTSANTANTNAGKAQNTADTANSAINNLSIGGRNLVINSKNQQVYIGVNASNDFGKFLYILANGNNTGGLYNSFGVNMPMAISFDWSITGSNISGSFFPQWNTSPWFINTDTVQAVTVSSTNTSGHYSYVGKVLSSWSSTSATALTIRTDNLQGTLTLTNFKFEKGNKPTDWTPAPEDVQAELAKTTTYGTTPPTNPQNGAVWYDTSQTPNVEKRYNSSTQTWITVQFSSYNIAAMAITAAQLAANSVTSQSIAANAINASKIQAGTITGAQMAAHTITAALIDVTDLHVYAANIDGKLTANQIDTANLYVGGSNIQVPDPADSTGQTMISASELAIRQANQISTNATNINNGFTQITGNMQDYVDSRFDPLKTGFDNLNGYVQVRNGVIYLGDSSNPVILTLDNDGISFINGSTILAQFTDKSLSIVDTKASLRLGKFAFQPRTNGNLSFVWIDQ